MKTISASLLAFLALATTAFGQKVSVKKGNVQFTDKGGKTIALTSSGKDSEPELSPDGKLVAFVRKSDTKVASGSGEDDATEIWIVGTDGSNAQKIVEPKEADKPEELLAELTAPHFTSDGKKLYFQSTAWATSGAVHVVDLDTKTQKFVCDGNSLEVVRSGEYKDHILVTKHKYFVGGGTYDWFWVVDPEGKEIGPVGPNTKNFKELSK